MKMYYSKLTGGFYDSRVHNTLPSDVVEITSDMHNELLEGAAQGYKISTGAGGQPFLLPTDPTEVLAAERAAMKCSRLQGRLVLGEATCDALDAMAVDNLTPWAMRQTIQNAIEWRRMSQSMTELGYLLGYTDEQMDDLFRQAMTVDV